MLFCKSQSKIRKVDNITVCSAPSSWDTVIGNFIREGWDATLKAANTKRLHADNELLSSLTCSMDLFIHNKVWNQKEINNKKIKSN